MHHLDKFIGELNREIGRLENSGIVVDGLRRIIMRYVEVTDEKGSPVSEEDKEAAKEASTTGGIG